MKKVFFFSIILVSIIQSAFSQSQPSATILNGYYDAAVFNSTYQNEVYRNHFVRVISGSDTVNYFVDVYGRRALMIQGASGGSGGTVNVAAPISGDGSAMDPVTLSALSRDNAVWVWDSVGGTWAAGPDPYNKSMVVDAPLGNLSITDGAATIGVPVTDIAPVQSVSGIAGLFDLSYPGGAKQLGIAQNGATEGQRLVWNGGAGIWQPRTDTTKVSTPLTGIGTALQPVSLSVNSIDSNYLKDGALAFKAFAPNGATNGQVPVYNSGTGKWVPGTVGGGSVTASNGLSVSGSDVRLGGTLTQNTNITGANFSLNQSGINEFTVECDTPYIYVNGEKFLHMGCLKGPTYNYASTALGYRALNSVPNYGNAPNTVVGSYAAESINGTGQNGASNAMFGYTAGRTIVTGSFNSIFGIAAMSGAGTSTSYSGAFGHHSQRLAAGQYNYSFGNNSLENITGSYNVAFGQDAMRTATSVDYGVGIGQYALASLTTGDQNVAVGSLAMRLTTTGNNCVGIGYSALNANTIGVNNTAVGASALESSVDNNHTTAVGYQAGQYYNGTAGSYNVFFGSVCGKGSSGLSTGGNNTFVGGQSGSSFTTGNSNVFMGTYSGNATTTGSQSVMIGQDAGRINTTGTQNIFIGRQAGNLNTTGSTNILIGLNAAATSATVSGELNIGNTVYGSGLYTSTASIRIGAATPTARLHLPAGSATASTAPMKITVAGAALLNSPEIGAVEVKSNSLYYTDSTATRRLVATSSPTFNADVLSYTPTSGNYVAVPANRASVVLNSGTATVAESVTEIVCKTGASTVNLNYTPGADFNDPFTTVRWIYNLQAITSVTVQTSQSWSFSNGVASAGNFSIPAGQAAKLIWSQTDNVFYYKLIP